MIELNHASLFSGTGGFDLASEWMGWNNVLHCEINPFQRQVLSYYWHNAFTYEDITKTDFTIHRGKIDILTGGFPCQPFSTAGKRKGTEDNRYLWPEMLRAIREIQPTWIVGENVRGIVNWNKGLVFEQVCSDLENEGYEVQPIILPACALNAPHRRDRVWFVAYANERTTGPSRTSGETKSDWSKNNDEQSCGRKQTEQHTRCSDVLQSSTYSNDILHKRKLDNGGNRQEEKGSKRSNQQQRETQDREWVRIESSTSSKDASNSNNKGLQRSKNFGSIRQIRKKRKKQSSRLFQPDWENFPTQSPICSGNDGFPSQLDGITFSKWRQESIKGYGNAIVPQVAYQIFKVIEKLITCNHDK